MPIYEYRCEKGHTFEVLQRMADEPVSVCTDCDARVERVLHPVAVHFKGSGFYTTDYGKKGKAPAGDSGGSGDSKDGAGASDKGANQDPGTTAGTSSNGGEASKTGTSSGASSG